MDKQRGMAKVTDQDLSAVWSAVSAELADASALTRQQSAWMRLSQPVLSMPGTFIVAAPDKFARSAFESKLRVPISEALSRHLGQPTQIAVTLQEKQAEPAAGNEEAAEAPVNGSAAADATIIFERPSFDQPPVVEQRHVEQRQVERPVEEPVEPPAPRKPLSAQNPPSLFDTSSFRPGDAEVPRAPEPVEPDVPATHTVRVGDTLYSIARRYGTTVAELQRLNGLGESTQITLGRRLRVR